MKKNIFYFLFSICLISCQQHSYKTITVKGNVRHTDNNKISLVSFGSNNNAVVLDTCTINKQGNYTLKSLSNDEELYAIKIEGQSEIWFVNDVNDITINIDCNNYKNYTTIGSKASQSLHSFVGVLDSATAIQKNIAINIDSLSKQKGKDSLLNIASKEKKAIGKYIENYCKNAMLNNNSAALQCFYLFYMSKIQVLEATEINRLIQTASLKHPNHSQLNWLKNEYSNYAKANPVLFLVGDTAANFNYMDIDSNKISLQSFAGKYLLINFWETKKMDCIKENDRIKAYYNKYKDKNFDVLSISLDSNYTAWNKMVRKDSLQWKQVRDTMFLNGNLYKKYQVSSLPYGVLINPSKKIVAIDLTGNKLKEKLQELFD